MAVARWPSVSSCLYHARVTVLGEAESGEAIDADGTGVGNDGDESGVKREKKGESPTAGAEEVARNTPCWLWGKIAGRPSTRRRGGEAAHRERVEEVSSDDRRLLFASGPEDEGGGRSCQLAEDEAVRACGWCACGRGGNVRWGVA